jgi:transcriptional regulator with XRE-family HTH domain
MPINKRYVAVDRRIGERVLLARRRKGLTQHEVAELVPMSPTAFNRLERGLQSVSAECLARLATILQVSSDYLLGIRTTGMDASTDLSTTVDGEETEHVPVMVATA